MKRSYFFFLFACIIYCNAVTAQVQTFDVFSYEAPVGWNKEANTVNISYSFTDNKTGSFCIINMYHSRPSEGSIQADFAKQWQTAAIPLGVTDTPKLQKGAPINGWENISGAATFKQNGANAVIILASFTGFDKTSNLIFITNDQKYLTRIDEFTSKIQLNKPAEAAAVTQNQTPEINSGSASLIGEWSSNSNTLANFVNSSGQYAGDASTASTTIFVFNANGTYEDHFNIYMNGHFNFYFYKGHYSINGSSITLTPNWYQHKIDGREVKSNNPNNLKITSYQYSITYDQEKNKPALKLICNWDACVSPDNLFQVKK